ncbi:DUF5503 domain-containing protein [Escherichia coli]
MFPLNDLSLKTQSVQLNKVTSKEGANKFLI